MRKLFISFLMLLIITICSCGQIPAFAEEVKDDSEAKGTPFFTWNLKPFASTDYTSSGNTIITTKFVFEAPVDSPKKFGVLPSKVKLFARHLGSLNQKDGFEDSTLLYERVTFLFELGEKDENPTNNFALVYDILDYPFNESAYGVLYNPEHWAKWLDNVNLSLYLVDGNKYMGEIEFVIQIDPGNYWMELWGLYQTDNDFNRIFGDWSGEIIHPIDHTGNYCLTFGAKNILSETYFTVGFRTTDVANLFSFLN